jgi:hypothetical protein
MPHSQRPASRAAYGSSRGEAPMEMPFLENQIVPVR